MAVGWALGEASVNAQTVPHCQPKPCPPATGSSRAKPPLGRPSRWGSLWLLHLVSIPPPPQEQICISPPALQICHLLSTIKEMGPQQLWCRPEHLIYIYCYSGLAGNFVHVDLRG